jgi:hypothetical protein
MPEASSRTSAGWSSGGGRSEKIHSPSGPRYLYKDCASIPPPISNASNAGIAATTARKRRAAFIPRADGGRDPFLTEKDMARPLFGPRSADR